MKKENCKDVILSREHIYYNEGEYERDQYIIDLDVGDKIKIQVFDSTDKLLTEKEFIAKYGNSHINCQWQDKGEKTETVEPTELQVLEERIKDLEKIEILKSRNI